INPGVSTLFGDSVYCDSDLNMWSVTLNTALGEDKLKVPPTQETLIIGLIPIMKMWSHYTV
ncbi:MAG: hypothetical protein WCR84_02530, partial [Candidatus Paceibacterota bacterium]